LEKEAFTIPINFVKILPVEIAYLMLVLEILLGLAILLFIWLRVVMPKIDFSRKYRAIINA